MSSPVTIIRRLETLSKRFPNRPVFFERPAPDTRRWKGSTYADLLARIRQYAAALTELGLERGDAVAIMLSTSLEWECCDKAVLAIGCTVVGVELYAPPAYLRRVVATARPRALILQEDWRLNAFSAESLEGVAFAVALNATRETESLGITVHPWATLTRRGCAVSHQHESAMEGASAVVFSSGTTGEPKGVLFSQQQLHDASQSIIGRFHTVSERDRSICWLPMSNLFQRMINLSAMEVGMRIYYHPDPFTILDAIRDVRPTVFIGVPRIYQRLYAGFVEKLRLLPLGIGRRALRFLDEAADRDVRDAKSNHPPLIARIVAAVLRRVLGGRLRIMISGSAPCPVEVIQFFRRIGIPLLEAYGVSENATPIAVNSLTHWKVGSVGRPLPPNEVKISDDGEVLVRGPGLCRAYLGTPEKQLELDGEGFYHTGDDGHFDADGFLFLSGRRVDVVKLSNGRRVNLTNVERSFWTLPNVDQVVAFGHGQEHVTCAIVPTQLPASSAREDGQLVSIIEAIQHAQAGWPSYQRVRGVLFLDSPFSMEKGEVTPNLKLKRSAIQKNNASELKELEARIVANKSSEPEEIHWSVVTAADKR